MNCKVLGIQLLTEQDGVKYHYNEVKEIEGYDVFGFPIIDSYTQGTYHVIGVTENKEIKRWNYYGKPHDIGDVVKV